MNFPSISELEELNKNFWIMKIREEEEEKQRRKDDQQAEAQEFIEEYAVIIRQAADEGKCHIYISNDYGGENDYFITFLVDLGYDVSECGKYHKKISWETRRSKHFGEDECDYDSKYDNACN